ncbi:MAG: F0F1 ATP synthase subunit A [Candidatus Eisenbacteria bacterium]|nr:F0F1 ATP synthase subunit A [Candidatus Eisenbacteria bacterium]
MDIDPDVIVLFELGPLRINATLVFSWVVMLLLIGLAWLVTRRLRVTPPRSRWQILLEAIVGYMREQIREVTGHDASRYLPFIGTLFLYISLSNLLAFVPGYHPPTGSVSTTGALALCVFLAVPTYGIAQLGVGGYLKRYLQPTPLMLPFHLLGELSRTLALAVRLFGNVMSGTMIAAVLLSVTPLIFPAVMQALGLLIGQIHAYIFAVLALVYIGSASRRQEEQS